MSLEPDKEAIGKFIKDIRTQKGESLETFGKRFSPPANKSIVSSWEKGRYLPNNERLKKIAKLGDTTVGNLLYGDELKKNVDIFLYEKFDNYIEINKEVFKTELRLLIGTVIDMPRYLLGSIQSSDRVEEYEEHYKFMDNLEVYGYKYIKDRYDDFTFENFISKYPNSSIQDFQVYKEEEWKKIEEIFDEIIETYKITFNENNKVWINKRFTSKIDDDLTTIRLKAIEEKREEYYIDELVQPILDEAARKIKELASDDDIN